MRTPVLMALLAITAAPIEAQAPGQLEIGALDRRIDSIRPLVGPAGTPVAVSTKDMPVGTPVLLGFGAPTGFEALSELLTGDEGDFDVVIEVPDWATWDRVHLVLVFDIYFRPIARSDAFHVTDADGRVQRRGYVVEGPVGCTILEDIDGVRYALTGPDPGVAWDRGNNVTLTIEGRISEIPGCGTEVSIEVDRVVIDRPWRSVPRGDGVLRSG